MTTYKLIRFYFSDDYDEEVVVTGQTLKQAQAYCRNPESSSSTATNQAAKRLTDQRGPWFVGYREDRGVASNL